ncbi:hypothetical protein CW304_03275 [Bacillus sp. UFRGS-B20]|nr:hypothetical protein CW304_03275 [Bacillus sp. UFRGS-B20]
MNHCLCSSYKDEISSGSIRTSFFLYLPLNHRADTQLIGLLYCNPKYTLSYTSNRSMNIHPLKIQTDHHTNDFHFP